MSLELKIEQFIAFKKEIEEKIKIQAMQIQEEYLNYIQNKDINLDERFTLWLKTPNDLTYHLTELEYYELSAEQVMQIKEFVLDTNLGETIQQESW